MNDEQWVEFMYEGRRDGFSLGSSQHYDRHHEQHLPKLSQTLPQPRDNTPSTKRSTLAPYVKKWLNTVHMSVARQSLEDRPLLSVKAIIRAENVGG